MNCGNQDFLCHVIGLLAAHGVELSNLGKLVPFLGDFITQHAQAIIGLLGFSFGIWKWWRFHDSVLHKRLREYLNLHDRHLADARTYVVEALHKPGEDRRFAEPIFSVKPLRKVLRRRNWSSLLALSKIETSAERQLDKALRQLDNRLKAADQQLQTLRLQQGSAHYLKGAISSARAGHTRSPEFARHFDYRALDAFRAALQVPGYEADIEMLEFEARQLMRLGYLSAADTKLRQLESSVVSVNDPRRRDLLLARVKLHRALIVQAQGQGQGRLVAHQLLCQNNAPATAVKLREAYAPYNGWEALDQADLHYISAYVCSRLGYHVQEASHLGLAETEYRRVASSLEKKWLLSKTQRLLKATATSGNNRVIEARKSPAIYDEKWLLPALEPIERPAANERSTSGNEAVEQTTQKAETGDASKT